MSDTGYVLVAVFIMGITVVAVLALGLLAGYLLGFYIGYGVGFDEASAPMIYNYALSALEATAL